MGDQKKTRGFPFPHTPTPGGTLAPAMRPKQGPQAHKIGHTTCPKGTTIQSVAHMGETARRRTQGEAPPQCRAPVLVLVLLEFADCCSPWGGASMSVVHGVAGATGHVARRESHAPARCSASDGGRSRFTSDCSMAAGGPPSAGGPKDERRKRGGARRRAPWQLTIKLVLPGGRA